MNILKNLEKEKTVRLTGEENFVNECKLLLSSNEQEERQMLKATGLDTHLIEADNSLELKIMNEKYFNQYKGTILHINDIKKIAIKYRLYLRQSGNYIGKIPHDLGLTISQFVKEQGVVLGNSQSYSPFFVLAPPRMFKEYKTGYQHYNNAAKQVANKFKRAIEPDPILFYKIDDNHYYMLKKWGNDITRFRSFFTAPLRTKGTVIVTFILISLLLIYIPIHIQLITPEWTFVNKDTHNINWWGGAWSLGLLTFCAAGIINFIVSVNMDIATKNNWKSSLL